jgi:hypothetical protein
MRDKRCWPDARVVVLTLGADVGQFGLDKVLLVILNDIHQGGPLRDGQGFFFAVGGAHRGAPEQVREGREAGLQVVKLSGIHRAFLPCLR